MSDQVFPHNLANMLPDINKKTGDTILRDNSSLQNINSSNLSSRKTSVGSGTPAILKKDSNEANDSNKDMEEITQAVKKRRRSVMFEDRPPMSPQGTPSDSRPSASKRRSIARRSLLAIPSIISIEDEVSKLCKTSTQSSTVNQMVDIGMRHSLLKLNQKENYFADISSLKSKITISSEQIADGAVQAFKSNNIKVADIIPSFKTQEKEKKSSVSDSDYIDPDELKQQQWILKKYQTETQKLAKEREKWKNLRRERNQQRKDAMKLHSETVSGMHRIGEDVSLSSCDRTFLSAKPNYSALLDVTQQAVTTSIATLTKSKSLVERIKMINSADEEKAAKAYTLTVASSLGTTSSSPKKLLRSFHSSSVHQQITA